MLDKNQTAIGYCLSSILNAQNIILIKINSQYFVWISKYWLILEIIDNTFCNSIYIYHTKKWNFFLTLLFSYNVGYDYIRRLNILHNIHETKFFSWPRSYAHPCIDIFFCSWHDTWPGLFMKCLVAQIICIKNMIIQDHIKRISRLICVIRSVNCYIYIMIQFQANSVSYLLLKTLSHTKNSISKKPVMQKSCILVFTYICRHSKHEKPFYYKYGAYYWGSWVFNIL